MLFTFSIIRHVIIYIYTCPFSASFLEVFHLLAVFEEQLLVVVVVFEVQLSGVEFQIVHVHAAPVEQDVYALKSKESDLILDFDRVQLLEVINKFDRNILIHFLRGHHFLFAHCCWSVQKLLTLLRL